MRWTRRARSRNLEDRRFQSGGRGARPGVGIGLGGVLLLVVLSFFLGPEVLSVLGSGLMTGPSPPAAQGAPAASPEEEELVDFMSFVLDDIQGVWARKLPEVGRQYADTRLVLFRDAIRSACGFAESAVGPFYCPGDRKVYLDLSFFEQLRRRFGAPGDFAQAYVIAHEVGHHIQTELGIERQVRQAQSSQPSARNRLQVMMELQADCLAGVWGNSAAERDRLDPGDVEEGLRAAAAIGDDAIQRQSTGRIRPESFTHGSSAQRVAWFRRGLESGDVDRCDTFSEAS